MKRKELVVNGRAVDDKRRAAREAAIKNWLVYEKAMVDAVGCAAGQFRVFDNEIKGGAKHG